MLGVALLSDSFNTVVACSTAIASTSTVHQKIPADKIRDRLKALNIKEASLNAQVDELFYAKHPDLNKRQQSRPEDNALREEWYKIAEVASCIPPL